MRDFDDITTSDMKVHVCIFCQQYYGLVNWTVIHRSFGYSDVRDNLGGASLTNRLPSSMKNVTLFFAFLVYYIVHNYLLYLLLALFQFLHSELDTLCRVTYSLLRWSITFANIFCVSTKVVIILQHMKQLQLQHILIATLRVVIQYFPFNPMTQVF